MCGAFYFAYQSKVESNNFIFLVYLIYAIGIIWTLYDFKRTGEHTGKFKEFFNQGFRCFIVVTLFMVVYIFVFYKLNIEESVGPLRQSLEAEKNKTPAEIEDAVKSFRKNYPTFRAGFSLFQYLVIGALVTGIGAGFFTQKSRD